MWEDRVKVFRLAGPSLSCGILSQTARAPAGFEKKRSKYHPAARSAARRTMSCACGSDALWRILGAIRAKCACENVDLPHILLEGGGLPTGVMLKHRFCSALVICFDRLQVPTETLDAIEAAYGCGYRDPRGHFESIAWKDFCDGALPPASYLATIVD